MNIEIALPMTIAKNTYRTNHRQASACSLLPTEGFIKNDLV